MSHRVENRRLPGFDAPPVRSPKRKRYWIRVTAFFLVLLAGAAAWLFQPSWLSLALEQPLPLIDGPRGLKVYVNPMKGWTLAFPETWHAETSIEIDRREYLERSWIEIMNMAHPFPDVSDGAGMDPRLVALRVGSGSGGRVFGIFCNTDTELPLSLKGTNQRRRTPILDGDRGKVRVLFKAFSIGGIPYNSVRVWVGSQASREDLDTMEDIVGSLSYTPTSGHFGSHDCSKGPPL